MDAEGLLHTHILSKRVSCSVGWSGIPVYRRVTLRPPFSTSQVKGASTHPWLQNHPFFLFWDSKSLSTHSLFRAEDLFVSIRGMSSSWTSILPLTSYTRPWVWSPPSHPPPPSSPFFLFPWDMDSLCSPSCTHYVDQVGLKLTEFWLPPPLRYWD